MGLDAIVYLNKRNFALHERDNPFQIDEKTGEVYVNSEHEKRYPPEMFTAIHRRLGNVAMIAALAEELSAVTSSDSILLRSVLSSGSHSGDAIAFENLDCLESEINLVKERSKDIRTAEMEGFLKSLSELIETAREQKNPIVFV